MEFDHRFFVQTSENTFFYSIFAFVECRWFPVSVLLCIWFCDFLKKSNICELLELNYCCCDFYAVWIRSDILHDAKNLMQPSSRLNFPTGPWFCAGICDQCRSVIPRTGAHQFLERSWKVQSITPLVCFGSLTAMKVITWRILTLLD